MKTILNWCGGVVCLLCAMGANGSDLNGPGKKYDGLPLSFEATTGGPGAPAGFLARGRDGVVLLTGNEVRITTRKGGTQNEPAVLSLKFKGANANARIEGLDSLPGKANYFNGSDPGRWRLGVPTFGRVIYHDLYPGVDLIFYGNRQRLEYDFVIQPGADPARIIQQFSGAEKVTLDANGDLVLRTKSDILRQHKPVIYQEVDGARKMVSGGYVLRSGLQAGFALGDYDQNRPLVVDPVLTYSQTFGGSGISHPTAVAVDVNQNIYLTGNTTSTDFPVASGYQTNFLGDLDAFVIKVDTNGAIVYSTYLGGGALFNLNQATSGQGIAVDVNGNAFITGYTQVTNFPTVNAIQSVYGGVCDAFAAEINSNGNGLVYSTYLGGSAFDAANGIALDSNGNAVITGYTLSSDFPTTNAVQALYGGLGDAFVAKLGSNGTSLIFSTYLGGSDSENNDGAFITTNDDTVPFLVAAMGGGVALDFDGNSYVTGWTYSTNFPVLNAYQGTNTFFQPFRGTANEDEIAYLAKFDPAGALVYSTYFGAEPGIRSRAIGVDARDNVYIAGSATYGSVPTTNAIQVNNGGAGSANIGDGFVAAFDATGTNLIYATYLGGSGDDQINGLAVRSDDGFVIVTGFTDSPNFPLLDSIQPTGFQGLFRSTNGAGFWELSNAGLPAGVVYSLQIDPLNPSNIYALTPQGCLKSTNSGTTWSAANTGMNSVNGPLTGLPGGLLVIDPVQTGNLYAGTFGGIFKTTNGAAGWTQISLPGSAWVQTLAIDPLTPSTLYAGAYSAGVFKSIDSGATWTAMNTGLNSTTVNSLMVDPQNSGTVYAGVQNFFSVSLFKSTNGGANWTLSSTGMPGGQVQAILHAGNNLIYAIEGDLGESATLCVTTNGGANWTQLLEGLGLQFTALAVGPSAAPSLGIALEGNEDVVSWPAAFAGYVLQSTPALIPAQWQNLTNQPAVNNGNNVVTSARSGSGQYYRLVATNTSSAVAALYLGTDSAGGEGVMESTDGGATWNSTGLSGDTINTIAVNPGNGAQIYAGLNGGRDMFVSSLTPQGQLYASSYIGGSGADQGYAIAMLDETTAVVCGSTTSGDFLAGPAPAAVQLDKLSSHGAAPRGRGATPFDQSGSVSGGSEPVTLLMVLLGNAEPCPPSESTETYTMSLGQTFQAYHSHPGYITGTSGGLPPGFVFLKNGGGTGWDTYSIKGSATDQSQVGTYTYTISFKNRNCIWTVTYMIAITP